MVVIAYKVINCFSNAHADLKESLERWYSIVATADWKNFHEMKKTFNSVDSIGNDRYVFNIAGNKCRIVAMIHFGIRTVYLRFIGTHSEYDSIDCKKI